MTTAYILVAIQFEEKDLVTVYGQQYEQYRKMVPMIVPSVRAGIGEERGATGEAAPGSLA
jgi:hypothetical protein